MVEAVYVRLFVPAKKCLALNTLQIVTGKRALNVGVHTVKRRIPNVRIPNCAKY